MIRQLTSLDGWQAFVEDLCAEPDFSDPKLSDAEERWSKLVSALNRPDKRTLGIYRGGEEGENAAAPEEKPEGEPAGENGDEENGP